MTRSKDAHISGAFAGSQEPCFGLQQSIDSLPSGSESTPLHACSTDALRGAQSDAGTRLDAAPRP
jgi:hypothetical protein